MVKGEKEMMQLDYYLRVVSVKRQLGTILRGMTESRRRDWTTTTSTL